MDRTIQLIGIYLIFSFCTEIITTSMMWAGRNNLTYIHCFTLIEFWVLSLFFKECNKHHPSMLPYYYILMGGTVIILLNSLFVQPLYEFNSYTASMVGWIIILYCIRFLYHTMDLEPSHPLLMIKKLVVWMLVYYAATAVVLAFSNEMLGIPKDWQRGVWLLRSFILLIVRMAIGYILISYIFRNKNIPATS
ncbi:MAG: hypothetical protein IPH94_13520 [Saprospiraceae bacterium]|nr:hypothetical protein [Saprospiraceae bacterium]